MPRTLVPRTLAFRAVCSRACDAWQQLRQQMLPQERRGRLALLGSELEWGHFLALAASGLTQGRVPVARERDSAPSSAGLEPTAGAQQERKVHSAEDREGPRELRLHGNERRADDEQ
jgi:hypothetical protein